MARKVGPNERAVATVVDALRDAGQLDTQRGALAELARTLAQTLDAGAGLVVAAVARELRATLTALVPPQEEADAFDAAMRRILDGPAPVGDAPNP